MNVFILCTGRTGSTTFARACKHVTNYTAAHESRTRLLGLDRLRYPPNHIEADNRLAWMLGRLSVAYGDDAFYVHLTRDTDAVAHSYAQRYDHKFSILKAYHRSILMRKDTTIDKVQLAYDYIQTVNQNIELFLKDRPQVMTIALEDIHSEFRAFWSRIGAQGNLDAALDEWNIHHNPTESRAASIGSPRLLLRRWKRILCDKLCD